MAIIRFMKMDGADNVATALADAGAGDDACIFSPLNQELGRLQALEPVPYGNKIALASMEQGEYIVKYGQKVGICTCPIQKGGLVHVHNVRSMSVDIPPAFKKEIIRQMHIKTGEEQQ